MTGASTVPPQSLVEGYIDRFGSHRVTRDELLSFARAFDPQPFHVDDAAAAAHPFFRELPASGWHTVALSQRMLVDRWAELGLRGLAGLGVEELEWSHPVYAGDVLSVEMRVLEARASESFPDTWLVRALCRVLNGDDEEVMRYTATVLFASAAG